MDPTEISTTSNDKENTDQDTALNDSSSIIAEISLEESPSPISDTILLRTPLSLKTVQMSDSAGEDYISTEPNSTFLPPNWPANVKYLIDYEYHPSISKSILDLVQGRRRQPEDLAHSDNKDGVDSSFQGVRSADQEAESSSRTTEEQEYDDIPTGHAIPGLVFPVDDSTSATTSTEPTFSKQRKKKKPQYEIRLITWPPTHPVLGSYGLFALKTLRPGLHLLDYISLVVPDEYADPDSDHTLYLSNDLNLDASVHGNHGRFVNDFRRIRTQEQGPNVGWDLYRDAKTGQVRMGCKVLKRIRKDEEILCTYGKAYWKSRGIAVKGDEWADGWDTDLDDVGSGSGSSSDDNKDKDGDESDDDDVGSVGGSGEERDTFRPPREQTTPSPIQEPQIWTAFDASHV